MNTKRKGNRNERRSMAIFEAAGYLCCRSAASLGMFDIVAIGPHDVILCQVKTRDWPCANEMELLREFKKPTYARVVLHRWRDRVRLPDVSEI